MTLQIHIGRRVPKKWLRRTAVKLGGLVTFQENIWLMIKQSMNIAKKKCNASNKGVWVTIMDREHEDMNYDIEWMKITIQGLGNKEEIKAFEKEEYEEAMRMYKSFKKVMKKELPEDKTGEMKKHFKTRILSSKKVQDAYKKGYGSLEEEEGSNIANKLLEMGILTNIELIDDYDARGDNIKPDF